MATSLQLPNNRDVIIFAVNVTRTPKATAESLATVYNVTALATAGQPSDGAARLASGYAFDASLLTNRFAAGSQTFTLGAPTDQMRSATRRLRSRPRPGWD